MSRVRHDLWKNHRARADVLPNGLLVLREQDNGDPCVMIWRPKAIRPTHNYRCRNSAQREQLIDQAIKEYDDHLLEVERRSSDRVTGDPSQMDPGAVLECTWGYEQTNVDFYQVLERKNLTVRVRKLDYEVVEAEPLSMTEQIRPRPGVFASTNVLSRRIQFYKGQAHVRMAYGYARVTDPRDLHHTSHYA